MLASTDIQTDSHRYGEREPYVIVPSDAVSRQGIVNLTQVPSRDPSQINLDAWLWRSRI